MAAGKWRALRKTLLRRKVYEPHQVEETNLKRCLSRWDVAGIGLGSTLGVGVYVMIGHVALNYAGPSAVLSSLIAAIAALLAGLCYAEFGARAPRAGAAYSYTYLALGEIAAFIVGWNSILNCVFSTATIARGLSMHVDSMLNMTMSNWFIAIAPMSMSIISPYFDFFACLIVLIMGALLTFGARESSKVNNLVSAANLVFIMFVVIVGAFAANSSNWSIPIEEVPAGHGTGGFFPYGVWGTLRGAAVCFYGFVGFDSICAAGEEVQEPRRVLPFTLLSVLGISFVLYSAVTVILTMMVPYYLQDSMFAVSEAFPYVGWQWGKYVVGVGSLFGLYASLFGAMFPLTRLLYAMAEDGLLVYWFSKLTISRQSPAIATAFCTVIIGLLAGLFEIEPMVLMMCIGVLISFTAVAASVIILRYRSDYTPGEPKYFRQVFGIGRSPTLASFRIIYVSLLIFFCLSLANAIVVTHVEDPLIPSAVLNVFGLAVLLIMAVQPQIEEKIYFKTPLVPLVPCISIYINVHLIVLFNVQTWIYIGIWTLIGLIVYFITICCFKKQETNKLQYNMTSFSHLNKNGKPPVQIIVESPTPPDTIARSNYGDVQKEQDVLQLQDGVVRHDVPIITEEIILHQAYIENNEEKEAKIIDLLDQVLQAEEDSYGEAISLKEIKEARDDDIVCTENAVQRKSLSELSDAGSDASLGNHGLSKYDVIAQVHREDLSRVNEEEEKSEKEVFFDTDEIDEHEQMTAFNDSDSRTDESGYSDTIDRNTSESLEEMKEEIPYIPVPPPMDENYFRSPNFIKSYTLGSKHSRPTPPPPPAPEDDEEENKHRESVISNGSIGDGNITFGSDRQINFMSKLNNLFQSKLANEEEEPRKRSHSTGNAVENTDYSVNRERSPMFLALKNEITSKVAADNLRPVIAEEKELSVSTEDKAESEEEEDVSLSKEDLKSKLENIFAAGGPQLLKPRLMKSNPPTPEESYEADTSSTESIVKLPKMDKNDTLKRQKDKFSHVLNSIKLSLNKDDDV